MRNLWFYLFASFWGIFGVYSCQQIKVTKEERKKKPKRETKRKSERRTKRVGLKAGKQRVERDTRSKRVRLYAYLIK